MANGSNPLSSTIQSGRTDPLLPAIAEIDEDIPISEKETHHRKAGRLFRLSESRSRRSRRA